MEVSGQLHILDASSRGETIPVPSEWEASWLPERARVFWRRKNLLNLEVFEHSSA